MTTQRDKKQYVEKPVVLAQSVDEQTAQNLPYPGPGLKVRVPLRALPAYLQLHTLVPFTEKNTDLVGQRELILYVRRQPKPSESANDQWRCLACPGDPEFIHTDMLVHLREVHFIDVPTAEGTKDLTAHFDGAGFTRSVYLYTINGMKFERRAERKKK